MANHQSVYTELRAKVLARFEGHDYDPDGPPVFVWHLHHAELLEILTEPIVKRIDYVIKDKDPREIPTRLEWMRPVLGPLPPAYEEAWKAYNEAWKAYHEAWKAYNEPCKAYHEAWNACHEAWKACHEARKAWSEARKAWSEARKAWSEATKAWAEATKAWTEARKAWAEARKAYDEAGKAWRTELEALHSAELPDCPWNGETLAFPAAH